MNNKIDVTSQAYLKMRFSEAIDYFKPSTKVEFDRIGFDDSTWYQELTPSYLLSDENYNRSIRVYFPNSLKVDDNDMRFTSYCITYNDEDVLFSSKKLDEVLGFLWSNLELLNELVDVDREKREIDEHNCEIINTIMVLQKIWSNIQSDIFYDARWDNHEYDANAFDQSDMEIALEKAIDIINKERK